MAPASLTLTMLYMTAGLTIWALRFVAAYAFTAIACSRGWEAAGERVGAVSIGVAALSLIAALGCAAIAACAFVAMRAAPAGQTEENQRFIHYVAASVALLALVAILWETAPLVIVPICR
jgi:hypothetical protein